MKHLQGIIATSEVDRHGEMLLPEALEDMVKMINSGYLPLGIAHDPRIPPIGRALSAKLVTMNNGIHAVEAISEIFEDGDQIEIADHSREIPIHIYPPDHLEICFDRTYRDPESQRIINEISALFGTTPEEQIKKAADPLSLLIIAGSFTLAATAGGFFSKLGADAYEALKCKVQELLRKKNSETERLLAFEFTIRPGTSCINVLVVLTNPTDADIASFFEVGLKQLDETLPHYLDPSVYLKKIVFEYTDQRISLLHGIRKDAVPLILRKLLPGELTQLLTVKANSAKVPGMKKNISISAKRKRK